MPGSLRSRCRGRPTGKRRSGCCMTSLSRWFRRRCASTSRSTTRATATPTATLSPRCVRSGRTAAGATRRKKATCWMRTATGSPSSIPRQAGRRWTLGTGSSGNAAWWKRPDGTGPLGWPAGGRTGRHAATGIFSGRTGSTAGALRSRERRNCLPSTKDTGPGRLKHGEAFQSAVKKTGRSGFGTVS